MLVQCLEHNHRFLITMRRPNYKVGSYSKNSNNCLRRVHRLTISILPYALLGYPFNKAVYLGKNASLWRSAKEWRITKLLALGICAEYQFSCGAYSKIIDLVWCRTINIQVFQVPWICLIGTRRLWCWKNTALALHLLKYPSLWVVLPTLRTDQNNAVLNLPQETGNTLRK